MNISKKDAHRFEFYVQRNANDMGCWRWTGYSPDKRYGGFSIAGKTIRAHRVSYLIYRGDIPDGLFVLHSCDNTFCVNPSHLFLGTNQDNSDDKVRKGRQAHSGRNTNAKLTPAQVSEIRDLRQKGVLLTILSSMFGVSKQHISRIDRNQRWRRVK